MAAPIEISPEAILAFKTQLEKNAFIPQAVRLGIRGGACSGFAYVIEFAYEGPRPHDIEWQVDGVNFRVDKKSVLYLTGSQLNWKKTLMHQGFEFVNPNEATRCGCGSSFSPK
jgi:iron-sulfur cluster assembly protein